MININTTPIFVHQARAPRTHNEEEQRTNHIDATNTSQTRFVHNGERRMKARVGCPGWVGDFI